ncbi:MAG TPA: DUF6084 family protein [Terriglobia bacterium]|nr:DUF6084 family protein [Terriglobia bacterium]
MPDLNFTIDGAEPLPFAASPHIGFRLRITNAGQETIHTVILHSQIQLDVARRRYTSEEQQRLADLFGEPERWSRTLRSTLWTNVTTTVSSFKETTVVTIQVPCTFDFNVAATKYFGGLDDGDIPISFYFNGTVFYAGETGTLQVTQISWEKEAPYRMPVQVWRSMMDAYYPNTAWLCLRRDVFDRLCAYKVKQGIPTFEEALEAVIR